MHFAPRLHISICPEAVPGANRRIWLIRGLIESSAFAPGNSDKKRVYGIYCRASLMISMILQLPPYVSTVVRHMDIWSISQYSMNGNVQKRTHYSAYVQLGENWLAYLGHTVGDICKRGTYGHQQCPCRSACNHLSGPVQQAKQHLFIFAPAVLHNPVSRMAGPDRLLTTVRCVALADNRWCHKRFLGWYSQWEDLRIGS